jgi:hypothetical protein
MQAIWTLISSRILTFRRSSSAHSCNAMPTTYLPCQEPPKLPIPPDVRLHRNGQIVSRIGQAGGERGDDGREDEEAGDGRIGEAGGYHGGGGCERVRITLRMKRVWCVKRFCRGGVVVR